MPAQPRLGIRWWPVLSVLGVLAGAPCAASAAPDVLRLDIRGIIDAPVADYVARGMRAAEDRSAALLLIVLDTPGGLAASMQRVTQTLVNGRVPSAVLVFPAGGRAASAGAFLGMAAAILAMAPGTHLGAAHPVDLQGRESPDKITQDAAAHMRSLAGLRGRPEAAAAALVTRSRSLTAAEAVQAGVADLEVAGPQELLRRINGRTVDVAGQTIILATAGARVTDLPMRLSERWLHRLTDPNVAYVLFLIGVYGLIFELASPGAVLPGVAGALCLLLALIAFEGLPVSLAGILFLVLGAILLVLELFVTSAGILTVGGLAALVLGSIIVFPSELPAFRVAASILWTMLGLTAVCAVLVLTVVWRLRRQRPLSGMDALLGAPGTVKAVTPAGLIVHVAGEDWLAGSRERLRPGAGVVVTAVRGLRLTVRPQPHGSPPEEPIP